MRKRNLMTARTKRHDLMLTTSFSGAWVALGKELFSLGGADYCERLRGLFHEHRNNNENNGDRN